MPVTFRGGKVLSVQKVTYLNGFAIDRNLNVTNIHLRRQNVIGLSKLLNKFCKEQDHL